MVYSVAVGNWGEMGGSCGKRVAFSMACAHVAKHRPGCPSACGGGDEKGVTRIR